MDIEVGKGDENIMYYAEIIDDKINGYYIPELHGQERCENLTDYILVDEELHDFLLSLGKAEIINRKDGELYTINDRELFKAEILDKNVQFEPTLEERVSALEGALIEAMKIIESRQ